MSYLSCVEDGIFWVWLMVGVDGFFVSAGASCATFLAREGTFFGEWGMVEFFVGYVLVFEN